MIYHFEDLGSTNDEATAEHYREGDIIVAERQSAGRGQRGHSWISGEGLNLTFSVVLEPQFLPLREQFLISQVVALALCDMLRSYSIDAKIKWTNDIYVGDRKIVGILIENRLEGAQIARSIVGVGININQREFDPSLPNPTSMLLEGGREYRREEILNRFSEALVERYQALRRGERETIFSHYHSLIYRLGESHIYRLSTGELRSGVIQGVEHSGELIIEWREGDRGSYLFREVEFVIESTKKVK